MKLTLQFLTVFVFASVSAQTPEKGEVVLLFAGDLVLSDHFEQVIGDDYQDVLKNWSEVGPFDIFMVNLEHPITTATQKVEKKFNFKMSPKYLPLLKGFGITLVNAANNHIADYGLEGLEETIRHLESIDIPYVGIGGNLQAARKPVVLEKAGWKIGFLGYFGGGDFAARADRAGFAPRRESIILQDVRRLRTEVDYLVVNFHWGVERSPDPEPEQVHLARKVIDAGADLIVGHHPHILQGIEEYEGKHIAYSLGNFVFGGNSRHTYDTALLKVTLGNNGPAIDLVPISVERWRPRPATGASKENTLSLVKSRSEKFKQEIPTSKGAQE